MVRTHLLQANFETEKIREASVTVIVLRQAQGFSKASAHLEFIISGVIVEVRANKNLGAYSGQPAIGNFEKPTVTPITRNFPDRRREKSGVPLSPRKMASVRSA